MASLATLAAVQPTTVKGLGGSSLTRTELHVKLPRQSLIPKKYRAGAVGSDATSPYNPHQSKFFETFFETFAAPFTKRGLLLKFLILGGGSLLLYISATASDDLLPIKKCPQLPPKLGPRGKI
ncbi:hypothetical protein SLA2020_073200 [Shorea laevis]